MNTYRWRIAWWSLFVVWMACGALNIYQIRVGILTSYGADLAIPAWLYIAARALDNPQRQTALRRSIGRTPERAAGTLFLASTMTEVTQRFWPRGLFPGTFDLLDILAYAAGLAVCYMLDKRSPRN